MGLLQRVGAFARELRLRQAREFQDCGHYILKLNQRVALETLPQSCTGHNQGYAHTSVIVPFTLAEKTMIVEQISVVGQKKRTVSSQRPDSSSASNTRPN